MNPLRSRLVISLLALAGLVLPACAQSDQAPAEPVRHPFLWRIEGDTVHWLYGTIHLPDKRVTTLPDSVDAAIDACDVLLTEIEVGGKAQAELQKATLLPRGTKLAELLPKELHARLAAYLEKRKFPIAGIERQKLWVVAATLPLLDDLRSLLSGKALDVVLVQEAKDRDKQTAALETAAEQIGAFEAFTDAEQVELLEATLDVLEQAEREKRSILKELVEIYIAGDVEGLAEAMDSLSGLSGHEALEAKFEKELITDRNTRMVERMVARMKAAPETSHFFAVGAAHYPGEQGILALLRAKGYRMERVGGDPPKTKAKEKQPAGVGRAP